MNRRILKRLDQLERDHAHALEQMRERADREDRDPIKKIELFLRLSGTEQGPHESLAEASARAMGISYQELVAQIKAGIDPIHKFLTEEGVFEEIERRKAAGTWPAAGGKEQRC